MIARIDGASVAYDDVGAGAPVVFIHAFPLNRSMWAPQTRRLAAGARCVTLDVRGFGESSATPPFTMARFADDVAALLDARRIDRAAVVGLSMGGYIAFALWRRHRDRVRAFVLADTRPTADTPEGARRRRALIDVARTQGSDAVAAQQLDVLVGRSTRAGNPEVAERIRGIIAAAPVAGIVGALEAMLARPDSTPTLATIDVPTLLVVGEEDGVTPVDDARAMQRAIPGSALEIIGRAGHLSNLEQPDAFNTAVEGFLAPLLHDGASGV